MARSIPSGLFDELADFEVDFFVNLVRSYAKLDIGMRGFFFHRIKQVVREAIELLEGAGFRLVQKERIARIWSPGQWNYLLSRMAQ